MLRRRPGVEPRPGRVAHRAQPAADLMEKRSDLVTVLAIAAIVYTLAKVFHEGLGHGLACVLAGGTLNGVSSSWCDCANEGFSAWALRGEKAAGTIANLLVAAAMIGVQRWKPR